MRYTHHKEAEYTDAVIAFLRRPISCAKAGVHIRIYVSSRTSPPKNGVLANEEGSIYGRPEIVTKAAVRVAFTPAFTRDVESCGRASALDYFGILGPRLIPNRSARFLGKLCLQCRTPVAAPL